MALPHLTNWKTETQIVQTTHAYSSMYAYKVEYGMLISEPIQSLSIKMLQ